MSWVLLIVAVLAAASWFGQRLFAARGPRLVECPETNEPAAVEIQAARAAVGGGFALSDCSRWPERQPCGRQCVAQIDRAPSDCLVRTVVAKWYEGKSCAVCGKPLGEIDWLERKPGLVDALGRARPWQDVAPEEIPAALSSSQPVCFDCSVALTFRRERPDLVLDNPWKP